LNGRQAVGLNDDVFVFLCCEAVASVPDGRDFCLEDAAVIRELEVSFFQHGVVVVCIDDVVRSASCIGSGSIRGCSK
jgi:hypothetical protein